MLLVVALKSPVSQETPQFQVNQDSWLRYSHWAIFNSFYYLIVTAQREDCNIRRHFLIARVFTNDWASLKDGKLSIIKNAQVEWLRKILILVEILNFMISKGLSKSKFKKMLDDSKRQKHDSYKWHQESESPVSSCALLRFCIFKLTWFFVLPGALLHGCV